MDLDLNANGHVESIDEVLGKKNIVAELFHMKFTYNGSTMD